MTVLANPSVSIEVDDAGRIDSLRNLQTGTELIGDRRAADAWRMVIPAGGHTIDFVRGVDQTPTVCAVTREESGQRLQLRYEQVRLPGGETLPIEASFNLLLPDDSAALEAWVELDNRSPREVAEVEFPVIGGLTGFGANADGRVANLIVGNDRGRFYDDVLHGAMPFTGPEYFDFGREHETALFEPDAWGHLWLDLWSEQEGLYLFGHRGEPAPPPPGLKPATEFGMALERFPTQAPQDPNTFPWRGAAHVYPPGTPRWLRILAVHLPRLQLGGRWTSQRITVMPHAGAWHAAADHYSAFRHRQITPVAPPQWLKDYTGWTGLGIKTYVGQVFHTFEQAATGALADQQAAGLNLAFIYGITALGCEGADFDWSPAADLGGEPAFRAMVEKLHAQGMRVMLLDHLHRYINQAVPEYRALDLERFAVRDKAGRIVTAQWLKETFLSYRRNEGPTPVWSELCPSCDEWLAIYLKHLTRMIALGADAVEIDCCASTPCYHPAHPHPPGNVWEWKVKFLKAARTHVKKINPEFALFCEPYHGWELADVMDGIFPGDRYCHEHGRIFRYMFPELPGQTVKVTNYDYDSVNKALCLGLGVDTEIWGLRKTVSAACPELARYIGEINRFRRQYAPLLMHGTYRDTLGAAVRGNPGTPHFGVLRSAAGDQALVLRNANTQPVAVTAALHDTAGQRLRLWRPGQGEEPVRLPAMLTLPAWGVAVILATR